MSRLLALVSNIRRALHQTLIAHAGVFIMTTGFDTRADRHTRCRSGLGGLDDFLASDVCFFHDVTSPNYEPVGRAKQELITMVLRVDPDTLRAVCCNFCHSVKKLNSARYLLSRRQIAAYLRVRRLSAWAKLVSVWANPALFLNTAPALTPERTGTPAIGRGRAALRCFFCLRFTCFMTSLFLIGTERSRVWRGVINRARA